jgi:hypothetical protein
MYRLFVIFFIFSLLFSCQSNQHEFVPEFEKSIHLYHFDRVFFSMDSFNLTSEINGLKSEFPHFFTSDQGDDLLIERFYDPQIRQLSCSVDSAFGNTDILEKEIQESFEYFYHYFPKTDTFTLYTWVSNFESIEPVLVSGTTILLALDMYLGSSASYYRSAPEYIRNSFKQEYILPNIFYYYFSSRVPFFNDNSFLSSMLHYGKIHYLSALMIPNRDQRNLMRYSLEKMAWAQSNEANIWAYFVENSMLFSSDQKNKLDFISEAPFSKFSTSWQSKSPGRIAQWIGWRIIDSYMNAHPEITLIDLISEQDSQKILKESQYKPKS